jgi:hypothetical protein
LTDNELFDPCASGQAADAPAQGGKRAGLALSPGSGTPVSLVAPGEADAMIAFRLTGRESGRKKELP